MIVSFGNKTTEDLYHGHPTKRVRQIPGTIKQATLRKLDVLNAAHRLEDLATPPGNHLKTLKGDFEGFSSIRVNDQWRIIFRWHDDNAHDVSLIDYH
jgi:proteic killer suppression protein